MEIKCADCGVTESDCEYRSLVDCTVQLYYSSDETMLVRTYLCDDCLSITNKEYNNGTLDRMAAC